jgi:hypothetical protein
MRRLAMFFEIRRFDDRELGPSSGSCQRIGSGSDADPVVGLEPMTQSSWTPFTRRLSRAIPDEDESGSSPPGDASRRWDCRQ